MVVTNALGAAFTATLLSVGDAGATFVFPEDGATNTLAFAKLSEATVRSVCAATGFVIVPAAVRPAYDLAKCNLASIDAQLSDGKLAADEAQSRRRRVREAFRRVCREKGVGEKEADRIFDRVPGPVSMPST